MKSEIIEAYRMPTRSMENTILVEDFILVDKLAYGIHIPFSLNYLLKYKNIE